MFTTGMRHFLNFILEKNYRNYVKNFQIQFLKFVIYQNKHQNEILIIGNTVENLL